MREVQTRGATTSAAALGGDTAETQADLGAESAQSAELAGLASPTTSASAGQAAELASPASKGKAKAPVKAPAAKAAAKTPAKTPAKEPEPITLGGGVLLVSRDPKATTAAVVKVVQQILVALLSGWGITGDPNRVVLGKDEQGPLLALKWDAAWGAQPKTQPLPTNLSVIEGPVAVQAVKGLAGYGKVAEKARLDGLLGGETNLLSKTARNHLQPTFGALKSKPEAEQKTTLEGLLSAQDAMPFLADEAVATTAATYTVAPPVEKKNFAFPGKTVDAHQFEVTFSDGVKIPVIAPKAPEAGYHQHTVDEAADAAASLPAKCRAMVKQILLNPVENPDDAYWATEYNQADFHSYMTAGGAGVVTIYPDKNNAQSGAQMRRGSMIHETGHVWSYQQWGNDTTKGKWVEWKAAMDKDKTAISQYGTNSIAEDVAETVRAYGATKGTPRFDEYKAIMPNRFTFLEKELG